MPDLQTMKLDQRPGNLDRRPEMGSLPDKGSFLADDRRQGQLVVLVCAESRIVDSPAGSVVS
jgi:hypothetical protein